MRMPKICVAAGVAAAVAAALITSGVTSGGPPAHPAHPAGHQPSARFLAQARVALVQYLRHGHPQLRLARPPHRRGPGPAGTPDTVKLYASYNWSGYVDESGTKGTFTKVAGSWTMPAVTCTAEDTIASEWVGFDGATSTDTTVEQAGTVGWCYEGVPTYYTWYEMYPAGSVDVGTSPQPGDAITASVTRSSSTYTLKLTDATNPGNSFSEKKTCATSTCQDLSAEWVTERPSFVIGIPPLADYGTWTLINGTETASGKSGTIGSYGTVHELEMVDATDRYVLSSPSALTDNNSFSTTWDNSY
jgi:hypothetical protein